MSSLDVADHVSVITGAASGMGAEVARQLADLGARLVLIDHDAAGLDAVIDALGAAVVGAHVVDLTDDAAVADVARKIVAAHPQIRLLVTAAGSSMLGDLDQLTLAEMRWLMDVNLWGTVSITKALLAALHRSPAAHITHFGSIYALAAPGGRIPYAMSKFAVRGFSEALRHELEGSTVTVGVVHPAGVKTGIVLRARHAAALDPAIADRAARAQAAMYETEPADAARVVVRASIRRRPRTLIGRTATIVDVLTRLLPVGHWMFMRRPLREATDTRTPIGR